MVLPDWLEAIKGALRIEELWMPPHGENDPERSGEFAALATMRYQFKEVVARVGDSYSPLSELQAALRADDDYAWTWFCNLACIGMDAGGSHEQANGYAATFMKNTFGVDVRTHERWKQFEAQWANQDNCTPADRAKRLMDQVMKTWSPPRESNGLESLEVVAQTSVILAIAYVMGREFMPTELSENQRAAIDSGLVVLQDALDDREAADDESPTLEHWLERWEAAIEAGQSSISREEAEKRYYRNYGRDGGHPNGEG